MADRFRSKIAGVFASSLLLAATGLAQMQMPMGPPDTGKVVPPAQLPVPEHLIGIGNVNFPISGNEESQAWFEQGINLFYDFWDYEASRAFEQSIRADPRCAICYWGLYQSETFRGGEQSKSYAQEALGKAAGLASHATKREKLYIRAAQAREAASSKAGSESGESNPAEIGILRMLVKKNPKDTTARIFLAEAVADGYDKDNKPRAGQEESVALLQGVLSQEPNNSAANHLWIHAVEASQHPEDALHSAEILASLAPTSGHMVHMPGHIFYRLGDYSRAQAAFDASTRADEAYMRSQQIAVDDDWNYVHNLMYSVANLLEQGRLKEAEQVSAKLTNARGQREDTLYPWSARDGISRINPDLPVALRTADWEYAIKLVDAADISTTMPNLEFLAGGLAEFASGMQAVEAHQPDAAQRHSLLLDASLWRMSQQARAAEAETLKSAPSAKVQPAPANPAPKAAGPVDAQAEPLIRALSIMSLELRASLMATENQATEAEKLFATAQQQEKDLGYHEPPLYIRPVGETEAAALLVAAKWPEAEAAYRQALTERPKSGFPLYGIALAKEKSGSDTAQTAAAYHEFLAAWKTADAGLPQVEHAQQWLTGHSADAAYQNSAAPTTRVK